MWSLNPARVQDASMRLRAAAWRRHGRSRRSSARGRCGRCRRRPAALRASGCTDLDHVLDDARHAGSERARPVALDHVLRALLGDEETDVGGNGSGEGHVGRLRIWIQALDRGVGRRRVLGRTPADRTLADCAVTAMSLAVRRRPRTREAPGGTSRGFAYGGRRTVFRPQTWQVAAA